MGALKKLWQKLVTDEQAATRWIHGAWTGALGLGVSLFERGLAREHLLAHAVHVALWAALGLSRPLPPPTAAPPAPKA